MFWNWLALVCTLLDSCSPNAAYRHKFGSSVGVQFAGTITLNNNDTTSNQTEAKEDAMLDDLLNSQMAVSNQSMPPPMKKFFTTKFSFGRVCSKKKPAKVKPPAKQLPAITFGEDLLTLASNFDEHESWVSAYLEGTSVCPCYDTITLSGEPPQNTSLSTVEKEAIGMYTSYGIFAQVNDYMRKKKHRNDYMDQYIGIVTGALMKIQRRPQYPSQAANGGQVQILYRGFSHSLTETQHRIESFWSTSERRAVALSFLNHGTEFTLLEITGGFEFARPIAAFSCRPDELEFLFLPGPIEIFFRATHQRFEMVNFRQAGGQSGGRKVRVNVVTGVVTA